jgi:putative cell wall-binding protein
VGPVAASIYAPVLLVRPTALPSTVASAITALGIQSGTVVGDTSSVSSDVKNAIDALCPGAIGRLGGANRYETAKLVVNFGFAGQAIDLDTLGIAVGTKFPDALAAGAALGGYGSPIMLTDGTSLSSATATFLDSHAYEVGRLNVFGSTDSISNSVMTAILDKIK